MKNRFASNRKKDISPLFELLPPVAFFGLVIGLFGWGLAGVDAATEAEKLRAAEQSVSRAAVQCYAVEGRYPPDIAYLARRYGLTVDEERYIVHYSRIADNLMPEILVLPRNFTAGEGGVGQ